MSSILAPIFIVILLPLMQQDKEHVLQEPITIELSAGTSASLDITLEDIQNYEDNCIEEQDF
jgi:hypothetical protein